MNITIFQAPSLMKFGVNLNMKTENSAISQYRIKKLNYSVSYSKLCNTVSFQLKTTKKVYYNNVLSKNIFSGNTNNF